MIHVKACNSDSYKCIYASFFFCLFDDSHYREFEVAKAISAQRSRFKLEYVLGKALYRSGMYGEGEGKKALLGRHSNQFHTFSD